MVSMVIVLGDGSYDGVFTIVSVVIVPFNGGYDGVFISGGSRVSQNKL